MQQPPPKPPKLRPECLTNHSNSHKNPERVIVSVKGRRLTLDPPVYVPFVTARQKNPGPGRRSYHKGYWGGLQSKPAGAPSENMLLFQQSELANRGPGAVLMREEELDGDMHMYPDRPVAPCLWGRRSPLYAEPLSQESIPDDERTFFETTGSEELAPDKLPYGHQDYAPSTKFQYVVYLLYKWLLFVPMLLDRAFHHWDAQQGNLGSHGTEPGGWLRRTRAWTSFQRYRAMSKSNYGNERGIVPTERARNQFNVEWTWEREPSSDEQTLASVGNDYGTFAQDRTEDGGVSRTKRMDSAVNWG